MKHESKAFSRLVVLVGVVLAGMFLFYQGEDYLHSLRQEYREHGAELRNLRHDNEQLRKDIERLKSQYLHLRKYLNTYAPHDMRYSDLSSRENSIQFQASPELPPGLSGEDLHVQQAYHQMLLEKQFWDGHLLEQYKDILTAALEPAFMKLPPVKNEESLKYFDELTASLRLHKKLIRDVRIFHSEIQFQQKHDGGDPAYKAYDYKLRLDPFARESSIADAMQQALSALSTGVYHQEAVEVLDRLGDEFTQPVRQEYERMLSSDGEPAAINYNFNIFLTFAKKIMDYTDTLASQSSIPLAPKALDELDYLHRQLKQSFNDLYEIGQQETIDAAFLDMEELERSIR